MTPGVTPARFDPAHQSILENIQEQPGPVPAGDGRHDTTASLPLARLASSTYDSKGGTILAATNTRNPGNGPQVANGYGPDGKFQPGGPGGPGRPKGSQSRATMDARVIKRKILVGGAE